MKGSPPASNTSSSSGGGIQLLSPSMQIGLRATAVNYAAYTVDNQEEEAKKDKKTVFDFDGFTLEAVRRRHAQEQTKQPHSQRTFHHGGSFHHVSNASSSGDSPRSPTLSIRASSRFPKASSYDGYETGSVRSMDEFDWNNRNTHLSSTSGWGYNSFLSSVSSVGTRSKRMSIASSTTSSAMHGGRAKQRAEVVMRGWLQRRRGRMIKRWKAQFCVLKSDNKLCLYASEDTVNGRLEGRFQLLRVTYHEKNGSFQMIGIGSDETPYKEEFRPPDDDGWRFWFQALRVFFDATSMRVALDRMPELSLVPGIDAALLREADDEDDGDDNDDFAQEVEEMIMRPYPHSGGVPTSVADDRVSMSNTSSLSSAASSTQAPVHTIGVAPSSGSVLAPSTRRKTVVMNPAARRASIEQILTAVANGQKTLPTGSGYDNQAGDGDDDNDDDDEPVRGRQHYLSSTAARASQRIQWSGGGSRLNAPLNVGTNGVLPVHRGSQGERSGAPHPVDCPMIERDSQNNPVPILERIGSESVVSHESDGGYSWNRF